MQLRTLKRLVARGEGPTLELKRSKGELREGLQTVCAFLNGHGGTVVFGVRADGRSVGQEVSDQTLRDLAQAFNSFEPPAHIDIERMHLDSGHEVLALQVDGQSDTVPSTFEGRAYERIQITTRRMSQRRYEQRSITLLSTSLALTRPNRTRAPGACRPTTDPSRWSA